MHWSGKESGRLSAEQVRRLTRRLKGLLREAGGSEFMTREQSVELVSITKRLAPIFAKYDTPRR